MLRLSPTVAFASDSACQTWVSNVAVCTYQFSYSEPGRNQSRISDMQLSREENVRLRTLYLELASWSVLKENMCFRWYSKALVSHRLSATAFIDFLTFETLLAVPTYIGFFWVHCQNILFFSCNERNDLLDSRAFLRLRSRLRTLSQRTYKVRVIWACFTFPIRSNVSARSRICITVNL